MLVYRLMMVSMQIPAGMNTMEKGKIQSAETAPHRALCCSHPPSSSAMPQVLHKAVRWPG